MYRKRSLIEFGAWLMLASFLVGGVVMPGVHHLQHSLLESRGEADVHDELEVDGVAYHEGHEHHLHEDCTLCAVATSGCLQEAFQHSGVAEVDCLQRSPNASIDSASSNALNIRGPPAVSPA